MDEQTLNNQQQVTPTATQAAATPAAQQTTPLQSSVTAQPAENLPAGVSDYSAQIAQMYDAQMAAKQKSMEDAYNQNMTTMQRAKDEIAPTYFKQGNDLATQYERTRRNNNMRADMNGLNTGAASQMDLAQQSNYLDAFGQIRTAQANAERQADQQIADLEVAYKSQVAQALADNDYQKATALLQEYQRRDNAAEEMRRYNQEQDLANAKLRAAYGDFGGFANLYGQGTADAMQKYWAMNNPDYAYAMGLISASEYEAMTGMAPGGYSSGYSSGGGGGSPYRRSPSSSSDNANGPGVYDPNNPDDSGSTPEITDADWAEFAKQLGQYDSTSKIDAATRKIDNAATNTADRYGLRPGTQAYTDFVNEYKRVNTPGALTEAQTHYSEIKASEKVAAQQAARAKNSADLKQLVADTKTTVAAAKNSGSAYSAEASKAAFDNSPIGKLWNSITGKSSTTTTSSKSKPTPVSR